MLAIMKIVTPIIMILITFLVIIASGITLLYICIFFFNLTKKMLSALCYTFKRTFVETKKKLKTFSNIN